MSSYLFRGRVTGAYSPGPIGLLQMFSFLAQFLPIIHTALLASAMVAAPVLAQAQQSDYPSKPIILVVPFPAGGPTDVSARLFARSMSETLGQPIVIDNRAGAGGTVGSAAVARAPADGYTLLWGGTSTLAVAPGLYKSLGYDARSFVPIGMALRGPMMLAGPPSLEARDLNQLIALGHSKELTVATAGNGSLGHLAAEHLRELTGMRLVHVPYRGGNPAITDALGAQVDLVLDTASALAPHIQSNRLRAYAVTGSKPFVPTPKVPLFSTLLPSYEAYAWFGPVARVGTPPHALQRLIQAMASAAASPDVQKELAKTGVEPGVATPEDFARVIERDAAKWFGIIARSGVKADQ